MNRNDWMLDPEVTFLNHGSFGSIPRPVFERQNELRERLERQPVRFYLRELETMLDEARDRLAAFLGADAAGLAFVPNATAGVNAVLRSLDLTPDDELIVTDHEYNACRNALEFVARRSGARVRVVSIPFPVDGPESVVERIVAETSSRTRLLLVDHVTSQTALVFPIERIIAEMHSRNVDVLVDGAHAPGMLPLDLDRLGAAWYTGNCHKWICSPRGTAFLYTREDKRTTTRPVSISHGANSRRSDRSRYLVEFDWTGTWDPTAWLSLPAALQFMESRLDGGWPALMERNHELALEAQAILTQALAIDRPAPDDMLGSMAAVPLPDGDPGAIPPALYGDPLQDALLFDHRIEVPVVPWPSPPKRILRVSCQLYNERSDYERLAEALTRELRREAAVQ